MGVGVGHYALVASVVFEGLHFDLVGHDPVMAAHMSAPLAAQRPGATQETAKQRLHRGAAVQCARQQKILAHNTSARAFVPAAICPGVSFCAHIACQCAQIAVCRRPHAKIQRFPGSSHIVSRNSCGRSWPSSSPRLFLTNCSLVILREALMAGLCASVLSMITEYASLKAVSACRNDDGLLA